jgi:hypothetical protein
MGEVALQREYCHKMSTMTTVVYDIPLSLYISRFSLPLLANMLQTYVVQGFTIPYL